MNELKPCPFCGSSLVRFARIDTETGETVIVFCEVCGASTAEHETNDGALRNWNKRANEKGASNGNR